MPPEEKPIWEIIPQLSAELLRLAPGAVARLRRMDTNGPGEMDYWDLASRCGFLQKPFEKWTQVVKIMAILTLRSEPGRRGTLHDANRPFGTVLCDGGNSGWRDEQPFVSETRLARFLALSFDRRGEALEGMARMLASSRDPQTGINCIDVACLLLSDDTKFTRKLAETYYRRLDSVRTAQREVPAA
ncbi:hypothetical protein BH24PSE2_BH24PSE2_18530 [soil metagenome]